MKGRRGRSAVLALGLFIAGLCTGCISQRGLLAALADDLALTAAAGTQGLLTGLFVRD